MSKRNDWILWILAIIIIVSIFLPKISDFLFSFHWDNISLEKIQASNFLDFWGTILGVICTLLLIWVTLYQNDRLMTLEFVKFKPLLIVNDTKVEFERYEKLKVSKELINTMRFVFGDPNLTLSFYMKNESVNYISEIRVTELKMVGIALGNKQRSIDTKFDQVAYAKEEVYCVYPSGFVPGEVKKLQISYSSGQNPLFYHLYNVTLKIKMIYLNGIGTHDQTLTFQIVNDDEQNSYIVGSGVFNENNIEYFQTPL